MAWRIEPLASGHDRRAFHCGRESLDAYLRHHAGQHARKDFGRTFVATRPGEPQVLGYYTLAASSVAFAQIPKALRRKLPRYPVPVAHLGKLAVDQTAQGLGLGAFLLMDALSRAAAIAEEMAIHAVEVHALDDQAAAFYAHFGFQPYQDQPTHLFLPMATIRALF